MKIVHFFLKDIWCVFVVLVFLYTCGPTDPTTALGSPSIDICSDPYLKEEVINHLTRPVSVDLYREKLSTAGLDSGRHFGKDFHLFQANKLPLEYVEVFTEVLVSHHNWKKDMRFTVKKVHTVKTDDRNIFCLAEVRSAKGHYIVVPYVLDYEGNVEFGDTKQ